MFFYLLFFILCGNSYAEFNGAEEMTRIQVSKAPYKEKIQSTENIISKLDLKNDNDRLLNAICYMYLSFYHAKIGKDFRALQNADDAKDIIDELLKKNRCFDKGNALISLATLYYHLPSWPISFGSDSKAEKILKEAYTCDKKSVNLKIRWADFWATKQDKDKKPEAMKLLQEAETEVLAMKDYYLKDFYLDAINEVKILFLDY